MLGLTSGAEQSARGLSSFTVTISLLSGREAVAPTTGQSYPQYGEQREVGCIRYGLSDFIAEPA
ncbi:hypothetical protein GCM10023068_04630 [Leifsonia shinshuensis]